MNYFAMPGIPKLSFNEIVENSFGRTIESYKNKTRKSEVVKQRHIIMFYLRKCKYLTLQDIADVFSYDHTTILHGINTFSNQRLDKEYQNELNKLPLHIKKAIENE